MQLYAGSSEEFIDEAVQKRIAERLGEAFYAYFRFRAAGSEFNSWKNSLAALATQLRYSRVRDHGVVLEMQLPSSSARLDCLIFGERDDGERSAVLIELKQWTEAAPSDWDECVESVVGGGLHTLLHPSVQASRYAQYLQDTSSAFDTAGLGIRLAPCSWLHNMHPGAAGVLRSTAFRRVLQNVPLFDSSQVDQFGSFIMSHVGAGKGVPVMDAALSAKIAPSRKLLQHTARLVAGEPAYKLIDDQVIAYNAVLSAVRKSGRSKTTKRVIVVKGGPGTGKSVIALNLLGTLSRMGVNVQHATGSKAFTENIWRILGQRSKAQVKFFNNFGDVDSAAVDVLLADESHRIRITSNNRFTASSRRSDKAQIDELIDASKTCVFFIDDHQAVRPGEVGSASLIREAALRHGLPYAEIDLRTQFRCAGSDEYIDWIDQLLEIRATGVFDLVDDEFDFEMLDTPDEVDRLVRQRAEEDYSARVTAGFCWPWSDPNNDGSLVDDVKIGTFSRPWNAKHDARRLAKGIPKASYWATDPGGLGQVGCVYTAQGFEFDYAGVIWGDDLVIRNGTWVGQVSASRDHVVKTRAGARFTDCVKNTYRVLLTRGLRGCYLYVSDGETREYVRSRLGTSAKANQQ